MKINRGTQTLFLTNRLLTDDFAQLKNFTNRVHHFLREKFDPSILLSNFKEDLIEYGIISSFVLKFVQKNERQKKGNRHFLHSWLSLHITGLCYIPSFKNKYIASLTCFAYTKKLMQGLVFLGPRFFLIKKMKYSVGMHHLSSLHSPPSNPCF